MSFNSLNFILFFPFVAIIYFIVPRKYRNIWLLLTSIFFYLCLSIKYTILLLCMIVISFYFGILISKYRNNNNISKCITVIAIVTNVFILAFFKYFNTIALFIDDNCSNSFNVILPIGISFYIFEIISYLVDVYNNRICVETNIINYALFISFFIKITEGPIERYRNFSKQLLEDHKFNFDRVKDGFYIVIYGYFLKMVIADRLSIIVNEIYDNPLEYQGLYFIIATVLFSIQIYCDFFGYSTIAIGTAKILGFELMDNFKSPYLSKTVAEFWRKWHISLTSWLKDYIYIPLGGNKKGKIKKWLNILIVFIISGIWHGTTINFIIWGILNGIYQIIGDLLKPIKIKLIKLFKINDNSIIYNIVQIFITFILISFTWIFFRANNVNDAFYIINSIIHTKNIGIIFDPSFVELFYGRRMLLVDILSILILLIVEICNKNGKYIRYIIYNRNMILRSVIIAVSISLILLFGIWGPSYDASSFIYFKF